VFVVVFCRYAVRRLLTHDHDPGLPVVVPAVSRSAVRGVVVRSLANSRSRELLMVQIPGTGEYKFPGGGVHPGEAPWETLARELSEECGAALTEVLGAYGEVVERSLRRSYARYAGLPGTPGGAEVYQLTSAYYVCEVEPELGEQSLERYERDLAFTARWVEVGEAVQAGRRALGLPEPYRWTWREVRVLEDLVARWPVGGVVPVSAS